jgi:hypothetical protein
MGNKNKNGNNIRIIADKPRNVEYTFIDDVSPKINATSDNKESKEKKDISYSVRRDKLKTIYVTLKIIFL